MRKQSLLAQHLVNSPFVLFVRTNIPFSAYSYLSVVNSKFKHVINKSIEWDATLDIEDDKNVIFCQWQSSSPCKRSDARRHQATTIAIEKLQHHLTTFST